ncbi:hypothetical protein LIER_21914 [Lithospermum erythrorhizon]|uniref:Uncharacterized protein n=1 Tax=Lithospermum erythrorhizon TaxID=34254 RepID=A0AAV3QVD2_LITER
MCQPLDWKNQRELPDSKMVWMRRGRSVFRNFTTSHGFKRKEGQQSDKQESIYQIMAKVEEYCGKGKNFHEINLVNVGVAKEKVDNLFGTMLQTGLEKLDNLFRTTEV